MINPEQHGFVFKYEKEALKAYTKPYDPHPRGYKYMMIDLIHNPINNWVLICQGDNETPYSDWDTMFVGRVPNDQKLRDVLEMIIE